MDVKSLMIGDWVYFKGNGLYARITEIYHTLDEEPKRMVSLNSYGARYCVPVEDIEPIAVTPEFLLKNAFVEMSKGRYVCHVMTGDGYFDIRLKDLNNGTWMLIISSWNKTTDTTSMFTASNAKMSVCELQHYIADCKIDKQIVL